MANCVQCGRQLPAFSFGKHNKLCQWCIQHEAAQRGEDSPIQRVEPAPWKQLRQPSSMGVTQAIFGVNVAVFIAMALAHVSLTNPTTAQLIHWGANYGPDTIGGQWWRLLTCVFVHIGIMHIALPTVLRWDRELAGSSALHREVSFVHCFFIGLVCLMWGVLPLAAGPSMLAPVRHNIATFEYRVLTLVRSTRLTWYGRNGRGDVVVAPLR